MVIAGDYYGKYVIAGGLRSTEPEVVLDFLTRNVFCAHGSPRRMLSDNGGGFKSRIPDRALKTFRAKQRFAPPKNPQANGLRERMDGAVSAITATLRIEGAIGGDGTVVEGAVGGEAAEWPQRFPHGGVFLQRHEKRSDGVQPVQYGVWAGASSVFGQKDG